MMVNWSWTWRYSTVQCYMRTRTMNQLSCFYHVRTTLLTNSEMQHQYTWSPTWRKCSDCTSLSRNDNFWYCIVHCRPCFVPTRSSTAQTRRIILCYGTHQSSTTKHLWIDYLAISAMPTNPPLYEHCVYRASIGLARHPHRGFIWGWTGSPLVVHGWCSFDFGWCDQVLPRYLMMMMIEYLKYL